MANKSGLPSQQCEATSKRSGRRCRRRVVGASVCITHGGKAPQVAARREARILEMRAELKAAARGQVHEPRSPHEVLLSAVDIGDRVLMLLWRDFQASQLSPELATALGE